MAVRVSGKQWNALAEKLLGRQDENATQGMPLGEIHGKQPASSQPSEPFWPGDHWPGYMTHRLERAVECRECGEPTHRLYQRLDALKVGPALCRECSLKAMEPKAAAARRNRGAGRLDYGKPYRKSSRGRS